MDTCTCSTTYILTNLPFSTSSYLLPPTSYLLPPHSPSRVRHHRMGGQAPLDSSPSLSIIRLQPPTQGDTPRHAPPFLPPRSHHASIRTTSTSSTSIITSPNVMIRWPGVVQRLRGCSHVGHPGGIRGGPVHVRVYQSTSAAPPLRLLLCVVTYLCSLLWACAV
jgi:hypothetical protein